jgi:hypothetical protein
MSENIQKDDLVRTDGWTGYSGLEAEFPNLVREKSEKKARIFSSFIEAL